MNEKRIFIGSQRRIKTVTLTQPGCGNIIISRIPLSELPRSKNKAFLDLIMDDLSNIEFGDIVSLNLGNDRVEVFNKLGDDEVDVATIPGTTARIKLITSDDCINLIYMFIQDFDFDSHTYLRVDSETVIKCYSLIQ